MPRITGAHPTEQREARIGPLKAASGLASSGIASPARWRTEARQKGPDRLGGYLGRLYLLADFLGRAVNRKEAWLV